MANVGEIEVGDLVSYPCSNYITPDGKRYTIVTGIQGGFDNQVWGYWSDTREDAVLRRREAHRSGWMDLHEVTLETKANGVIKIPKKNNAKLKGIAKFLMEQEELKSCA